MPFPFIGAGLALAGLFKHGSNYLSQRSQANQMDKYNREQEAKTLAYRTRQGAKGAGAFNMAHSIAKAYGIGDSMGGEDVQGPLSSVVATPYQSAPVMHPSLGAAAMGAAGDLVGSAAEGAQQQMTYQEFQDWLKKQLGGGDMPSTHSTYLSSYTLPPSGRYS